MMITMTVCSVLYAEKITVSGTVTDNAGKALEGVKVTFAQTKDLSVVTKADGAFTLTNATSLLLPRDLRTSYGISFRNNAIIFTNASEKVSGILSLYSINGRQIASVALNNLQAGQQALVLPRLSSGTYLLAGTVNGEAFTRSLVYTWNDQFRSKATEKVAKRKSFNLSKRTTPAVVDTLVFSKDGYNTQK